MLTDEGVAFEKKGGRVALQAMHTFSGVKGGGRAAAKPAAGKKRKRGKK